MYLSLFKLILRLTLALVLSSTVARAHEVVPTIVDVARVNGAIELDMRLNLEAFLANVDLDGLENTDDTPQAADYDALRALPSQDIAQRAPQLLERWNAVPLVQVDGAPVTLQSGDITIPDDIGDELPRIAEWSLRAQVPDGNALVINWPAGGGDLIMRQQGVDDPFTGLVSGGGSSPEISFSGGGAQGAFSTFVDYIPVGFDHILPKGLDHILFVLGLFFLSTHLRPLVWQVSAFTLAHTVTLALGALGLVNVPGSIVEPLIAASIVFVAVENIFAKGLTPWRPVIIFGFGLLHGLGFASVLGEFGLPQEQFIPALIGFNIGVELGQLTVIGIAFALVGWAIRKTWYRQAIAIPASCSIAAIGAYWVIERTLL
ncbi:HupE/UreJ family protein [Sulfitobacter sp. S190]|uniref:HupE/UreJ family protein n=1 Tax=Sulfitobacter sp. S190 TaxID=2867022 RepID=UPI0021A5404A|nr:HupE/UreJ family protein [Sulfitobacter sp. S190]UWR24011.1 HupE/UreJ family protein [Sulfitobacter sp. S190]